MHIHGIVVEAESHSVHHSLFIITHPNESNTIIEMLSLEK